MTRARDSVNAVTMVAIGSTQDRLAEALYERDARHSTSPRQPWRSATRPQKVRYLDLAQTAINWMQA